MGLEAGHEIGELLRKFFQKDLPVVCSEYAHSSELLRGHLNRREIIGRFGRRVLKQAQFQRFDQLVFESKQSGSLLEFVFRLPKFDLLLLQLLFLDVRSKFCQQLFLFNQLFLLLQNFLPSALAIM